MEDDANELRCLKVQAVAQVLAISRAQVYKLMDAGELPYVKIGKSRRVRLDAVRELIARNTTQSELANPKTI
jgi:excisionase family DNA binding protein